MNALRIISIVLMLTATVVTYVQSAPQVLVTLYYESYCPYSKAFITSQLIPTYNKIGSIMNIQMVPISLLASDNQPYVAKFKCQHGPSECSANLLQSCALRIYGNNNYYVLRFIFCMESGSDVLSSAPSCANIWKLDYSKIRACATSSNGFQYQLANSIQRFSLNPSLPYFPWITINGATNSDTESRLRSNLMQTICNYYTGSKPAACRSSG